MHLAGTMFAQMAGVNLVHVPYKGSVPGITDMIGGHLPAMFDNLPASLPHIQAGKLKALAVAGKHRSPSLPDVPTVAEAGLPGYEVDPWFGVYGPAGLDPRIVKALNEAFVEALALPAIKDKLEKAGFTPQGSTAQELETLTQSTSASTTPPRWASSSAPTRRCCRTTSGCRSATTAARRPSTRAARPSIGRSGQTKAPDARGARR
jgi:tripartite-type tricarboxylate transporter receptor subunit TctC